MTSSRLCLKNNSNTSHPTRMRPLIVLTVLLIVTALPSFDASQTDCPVHDTFLRCVQQCRINDDNPAVQLNRLRSRIDALESKLESSQRQVAFTARNSADPFNVAAHGTLHYNVADLNLGGGFDTNTGVFTCPTAGLYVFTVSCMADGAHDEDVKMMANGSDIGHCYSNSQHSPEQGATSAPVHLSVGQSVWVQLVRDTARKVRGGPYNRFTGYLLKSD